MRSGADDKPCEVLYGDLKDIKSRFKKHSVQVAVEGEIGDLPGVIELVLAPDTTPQMILDRLREQRITINRFKLVTTLVEPPEKEKKVIGYVDEVRVFLFQEES